MSTVADLRTAVKRFVFNNTNALDAFQGKTSDGSMEIFIDEACMTAMNNARKYAERNASFDALDTVVLATLVPGIGINKNRCYIQGEDFIPVDPGGFPVAASFFFRRNRQGILFLAVRADLPFTAIATNPDTFESFQLYGSGIPTMEDGLYQVWNRLRNETILGDQFLVFQLNHRSTTFASPLTWAALPGTLADPRFNKTCRMNAVTRASVVGPNGQLVTPLLISTKQLKHRLMQSRIEVLGDGYVDSEPFQLVQSGSLLTGTFSPTSNLLVELGGTRWLPDYVESDLDYSDFFLEDGFDFMMWQSILELNYIVQIFVPRVEGALSPPERARNEAWIGLMTNDAFSTANYYDGIQ